MTERDLLNRIAAGRTDLVFDLPVQGALGAGETGGGTPLSWCAYYGDVSAIRHLLAKGASTTALGENFGLTAAAFHGHWQLVQFLVEIGGSTRWVDPETGETPLHAALSRKGGSSQHQVVRVLLGGNPDLSAVTLDGRETGSFMRDARTRGETPLHRAAAFAENETLDVLLAAGARCDAPDARGDTPLSWASWACRPDRILRRLCYGPHHIHPDRQPIEVNLIGQAMP